MQANNVLNDESLDCTVQKLLSDESLGCTVQKLPNDGSQGSEVMSHWVAGFSSWALSKVFFK